MIEAGILDRVLKRDRAVMVATMIAVTILCWIYMVRMAGDMVSAESMNLPSRFGRLMTWCGADYPMTFLMWAVMMVGMMIPAVAPQVLTFGLINRKRAERGNPFVPTGIFLGGYLIAWTLFSAVAALAQYLLLHYELLDPIRQSVGLEFAGLLLIVAGLFQFTPAKRACLKHCRSPLDFMTTHWREGKGGALRMGLGHGFFCIGCCWILMMLLFVAGVMNLIWVAAITLFVMAEKLLPWRRTVVWGGAAICLIAGLILIFAGLSLT
jgi:predicted metal-binding membrane protein